MRIRIGFWCLALAACLPGYGHAAEYFTSLAGADANNGLGRETAFATIQRGVDALAPGDTLTILPGEYFGLVRREGLGGDAAETVIRAAIPGTVTLRGDRPAGELRRVEGYRYVYVMDFGTQAHVVNELDTLSVLEAVPNVQELEFNPGTFYQDLEAGKLYLSATDLAPALEHHYTVTVSGTHGIYLRNARRVTIEGLAVTGFNRFGLLPLSESISDGATWGIFLQNAGHCAIRDCHAYFNGRGIALSSGSENSGDSVIERCVAWANISQYGGSFGGLSLYQPRRDVIRDSIAFRNGTKGVNIRVTDAAAQRGEGALSRLVNNLSWGNPIDIRIKAASSGHIAERNVAMRPIEWFTSSHNLFNRGEGAGSERLRSSDTIVLAAEQDLDPRREFADPDNFDYRLQATSRFRGTGPDGADQGPFPYQANIYYVSPGGDDAADGRSAGAAWRTLGRAVRALAAGDTLYLEAGAYQEPLRLAAWSAGDGRPLVIRGRGLAPVVIQGPVEIARGRGITFERLDFAAAVTLRDSEAIEFRNSRFTGPGVSLRADNVAGLRVTHSEFTGFGAAAVELRGSSGAFFSGNIFDNARGPAVRTDAAGAIGYSDYNSYRNAGESWVVGNGPQSVAGPASGFERHALDRAPRYETAGGAAQLENPGDFAVGGPFGGPLGVYLPQVRYAAGPFRVDGPILHSATATTANIEWWSSRPETFEVRWGDTPEAGNSKVLAPINPYHPHGTHLDQFNTFSLTGLAPGTQYHFRLRHEGVDLGGLTFTTAAADPAPRTLFVAPGGDDGNRGLSADHAFRTVGRAADLARPGDTVLIAGGTYQEVVRVRTTGDDRAPVTFRAAPGEKVVFDGHDRNLRGAFNIFNKAHISVDGLYFQNFGRRWTRGLVNVVRSRDISITRCFADGRSRGTSPELVTAGGVENLVVKNCVLNGGWGFLALGGNPGLRVENNVVIRVDITPIGLGGPNSGTVIRNNIITDNLEKKRSAALAPRGAGIELAGNCFFLRWPESERSVFGQGGGTLADDNRRAGERPENIAANPGFAVQAGGTGAAGSEYFSDGILRLVNDFPDAFVTNPELAARGIGLQPEAFADFHFRAGAR